MALNHNQGQGKEIGLMDEILPDYIDIYNQILSLPVVKNDIVFEFILP